MNKPRPSYPQIRSRQRYIIDYLHSTGKTYKQGARDLGVAPSQLKYFLEHKPQYLRRQYNRSETIEKLYESGGKRHTADIRPMARIQKKRFERVPYKYSEVRLIQRQVSHETYERYTRAAGLIRHLYVDDAATEWNIWTLDRGLPVSIRDIRLMYNRGEIDEEEFEEIQENWREIYNVADTT